MLGLLNENPGSAEAMNGFLSASKAVEGVDMNNMKSMANSAIDSTYYLAFLEHSFLIILGLKQALGRANPSCKPSSD